MQRPTLVRVLLAALVAALAVLPASALGAKPIAQFHDHFTDTFSDVVCGIPVDGTAVGTDNFFLYADDSFKDTSSVRVMLTNPVNGKSVIISNAGQVSGPPPIVDEQAGTITFLTNFKACRKRSRRHRGLCCSETQASSSSRTPSIW